MADAVQPRVQAPSVVARGDVFQVKALISHPMETGLRRDAQGGLIPRNLIHAFSCRYNDVEVFRADLHEAVAANPFLSFYVRAEESGRLQFMWEQDGGETFALAAPITVAA